MFCVFKARLGNITYKLSPVRKKYPWTSCGAKILGHYFHLIIAGKWGPLCQFASREVILKEHRIAVPAQSTASGCFPS